MNAYQTAVCMAKAKHRSAQSWRRFARDPEQVSNSLSASLLADAYAHAARDLIFMARMIRIEGKT